MTEFFTWAMLASFAGATIGTTIVTQFIKGALKKIPTQIVSYIVAVILLAASGAATGALVGWEEIAMIPLNAILVSISANGGYSAIERFKEGNI